MTLSRIAGLVCAALLTAAPGHAAPLQLFAAASTAQAVREAVAGADTATGGVVVVTGSSAALARQIAAGAPADLVLLANTAWADWLAAQGLLAEHSRVDLLGNQLVLITPVSSSLSFRLGHDTNLGARLGDGRLALAETRGTPAGIYARQALTGMGLWPAVAAHAVYGQDVRVALAWVARGEVAAGIVYHSDAKASDAVRIVDTFPAKSHDRIVYPLAIVAGQDGEAARTLQAHLLGPTAAAVFQRHGFTMIGQPE